ncbi:amidohydrolase [Rhodoferax sp. TH121]|uniref:amidohydrolase family protein n=1 Tax=Rhodoferax sp. TH121 TaxID=2022803 RepID=UPI000B96AC2F|nr:amidohydrolase family protein [Rhodoferax sp. TH121]OYQ42052.1 amidohydrolase [Rhodoferax sp. TH121]
MKRRQCLAAAGCAALWIGGARAQEGPASLATLKAGYARRIKRLLAQGHLPYMDVESSCNPSKVDIAALAAELDRLHIGAMALSSDMGSNQFERGVRRDHFSRQTTALFPEHFIPVGNGGQPPFTTEVADAFLQAQEAAARGGEWAMLGEYEFRHYPSPRQVKRGADDRDVTIPLDGPVGHRLFAISESTGLAFQLHYEIEDALLPALEQMLLQYPMARVVWCHVGQIRYQERSTRYGPAYLDGLLSRCPNLYLDTAFGDARSIYPLSRQRHSRVWADDGTLQPAWRDLMAARANRFLSALDLGSDRLDRIQEYDQKHRYFLSCLPAEVRQQVAFGTAWRLMFGEDFA